METHHITTRTGWPDDIPTLTAKYPRPDWDVHPHLRESTRQWMGAHQGFRRLADVLRDDAEHYLDAKIDGDLYAARLARYGRMLTMNLHGHHTWEDRNFFPEINSVDPRFEAGLEVLEADHLVLDETLDRFKRSANRVVQLMQLEEAQAFEEAGDVHRTVSEIEGFLKRHLTDEEDLIVPIILHHKMRG